MSHVSHAITQLGSRYLPIASGNNEVAEARSLHRLQILPANGLSACRSKRERVPEEDDDYFFESARSRRHDDDAKQEEDRRNYLLKRAASTLRQVARLGDRSGHYCQKTDGITARRRTVPLLKLNSTVPATLPPRVRLLDFHVTRSLGAPSCDPVIDELRVESTHSANDYGTDWRFGECENALTYLTRN